jgi:hypothetical protein
MTNIRLSLSWSFPDNGSAVLTFDKDAWAHFENYAREIGVEADEMISLAIVRRISRINSYKVSH